LERRLTNDNFFPNDEEKEELDDILDAAPEVESLLNNEYEELERKEDEEPSPVELKPLPDGLRYEYLDEKGIYPIIVNDKLSKIENKKLLNVHVEQCEACDTLSDIKGIDPSIVTHKIPMDKNAKPFFIPKRGIIQE
jgi:hypothetical protein